VGAWQHAKKVTTQQNSRQVWRTHHNHFFGGDKINTMYSDVRLTIKSLHYSGNHKNFTFDKYCTAHVEQHSQHTSLLKYSVAPLEESMKIHFFEEGITDSPLALSRALSWLTTRSTMTLTLLCSFM
jgi:hypothetical protein